MKSSNKVLLAAAIIFFIVLTVTMVVTSRSLKEKYPQVPESGHSLLIRRAGLPA